jgi:hypothetical protein
MSSIESDESNQSASATEIQEEAPEVDANVDDKEKTPELE